MRRNFYNALDIIEERAFSEGYQLGQKMFGRVTNYEKWSEEQKRPEYAEKMNQRAQRDAELMTNSLREEARREVMTGRQSAKAKELIKSDKLGLAPKHYGWALEDERKLMLHQLKTRKEEIAMKKAAEAARAAELKASELLPAAKKPSLGQRILKYLKRK